jgi:hypothetical protein
MKLEKKAPALGRRLILRTRETNWPMSGKFTDTIAACGQRMGTAAGVLFAFGSRTVSGLDRDTARLNLRLILKWALM